MGYVCASFLMAWCRGHRICITRGRDIRLLKYACEPLRYVCRRTDNSDFLFFFPLFVAYIIHFQIRRIWRRLCLASAIRTHVRPHSWTRSKDELRSSRKKGQLGARTRRTLQKWHCAVCTYYSNVFRETKIVQFRARRRLKETTYSLSKRARSPYLSRSR